MAADAHALQWQLGATAPGSASSIRALPDDLTWLPVRVPSTVADALRESGQLDIDAPPSLTATDYWYRTWIEGRGERVLRLDGLATLAEVWLDDELLLRSDNMFVRHDVRVTLSGRHQLGLCFRALDAYNPPPSRRARWRPLMIPRRALRSLRTSLLGHMPGWCPAIPIVGPWRGVDVLDPRDNPIRSSRLHCVLLECGSGVLDVHVSLDGPACNELHIECAGSRTQLERSGDAWHGQLHLDDVSPWWPHTHGEQPLYEVMLFVDGKPQALGRVGFRRIRIERGDDGAKFAVYINDVPVFCRGANWIAPDLIGMRAGREHYLPWIQQVREASMNMVRVSGTTTYEAPAFYELCDELGIMVWQDCMFANFDYPVDDPSFQASVDLEIRQFLERTSASPCLTVLCGGSEVAQQAAMLGLPRESWSNELFDEWLPAIAREVRPDLPYVTNSPCGGDLPFRADTGVTHYYGVGAYRRELEDARRAQVRFATECLAFANVPEPVTLRAALPGIGPGDPAWKRRTPRDQGASWDFEDVRDHYLQVLFGEQANALKRDDEDRYLTLSRATTAEVIEATIAEWRLAGSTCAGALVWTLQDLWPGAGWGLIDSTGEPKSTWYAMRRACRPVQVVMSDEGLNGLAIHCINDRASGVAIRLEFACLSARRTVASATQEFALAPRGTLKATATDLLGAFFDVNHAYRFGPAAHEACVVAMFDAASNELLADAFHFVQGRQAMSAAELSVQPQYVDDAWWLKLDSTSTAVSVHIDDDHYRPIDNGFHLAPGRSRHIKLVARARWTEPPAGAVSAINGPSVRYQGQR